MKSLRLFLICSVALYSGWGMAAEAGNGFKGGTPEAKAAISVVDQGVVAFEVAPLVYVSPEDGELPTDEKYLVAYTGGYPEILDKEDGHDSRLETRDLDGDSIAELLWFFHAGANQYKLKIYSLNKLVAKSCLRDALASNLGEIDIEIFPGGKGSLIRVRNSSVESETRDAKVVQEKFKYNGCEITPVK